MSNKKVLNSNAKDENEKKISRKQRRKNRRAIVLISLFTISLIIFIFTIIALIKKDNDIKKNKDVSADIQNKITVNENENLKEQDKYEIDFENLKKENSDTAGFIKVNGTDVQEIVVKGRDNSYYLNHNFHNQYNSGGWLFMDYHNKLDGNDKNIIIYGHNMRDNSMFGSLSKLLTDEWKQDENNYNIIFNTESENNIYKIFSVYRIKAEEYYIKTSFYNGEFTNFCNTLKNRSSYDFNIDIDGCEQIITLSTCSNSNYRLVVHAAKLE